jgi:hypothetical protein
MPAYSGCSGGLAPPKDLSKSPGNCAPVLHLRDNARRRRIGALLHEPVQHAAARTAVSGWVPLVSEGLQKLGAQVIPSPDEAGVLRFRDLDGITLEIRAN